MPNVALPRGSSFQPVRAPLVADVQAPRAARFDTPQFDTHKLSTPQVTETLRTAMSSDAATQAGRNIAAAGQAVGNAAGVAEKIAFDIQNEINTTLVDDATTRARELQMKLAYGDEGFSKLKGFDAVNRPDGKSLSEEYTAKFDDGVNSILEGITSEPARKAFMEKATMLRMGLEENTLQHSTRELQGWQLSTAQGTIASATQSVIANRFNPIERDNAIMEIRAAAGRAAYLTGASAPEIEAAQLAATTKAHVAVLTDLIERDELDQAKAYLAANKFVPQLPVKEGEDPRPPTAAIDAASLLTINRAISKQADVSISTSVSGEHFDAIVNGTSNNDATRLTNFVASTDPSFMNPDALRERLTPIVLKQEGGGTLQDEKVSPKGARGPMQVMPGTQRQPGFGVRAARDDSPEERMRVGRDYLGAMIQKYDGNPELSLAAYNAGPGAVDEALAKQARTGKPWLNYLPLETRNYVREGSETLRRADGDPGPNPVRGGDHVRVNYQEPTLEDLIESVRSDPRIAGSPTREKYAVDDITRRFAAHQSGIKQREGEATDAAYVWLDSNPGKTYLDMPPSLLNAVPGATRPALRSYSVARAKGVEPETNWSMYADLRSDPKQLLGMNMSALRPHMSDTEFKELADLRGRLLNPTEENKTKLTQVATVDQMMDTGFRAIGLDPSSKKPEDAQKLARARQAFMTRVAAIEQGMGGKKMTPEQLQHEVNTFFVQVPIKENPGAWFTSRKPVPLLEPDDVIQIPANDRKQITAALVAMKRPVTEANIRDWFIRSKGPK